ncbi:MAG: TetR/AcrR family transcriptional regulator [Gammaproteobacteria bacterium]|nr:TetR/AcrR family transcriptional regulator [Gammaproteobacteria bacterium]
MQQDNGVKNHGWRGSETFWLDAAHRVLIESGVESVKVMSLANALDMSRSSFYWHFKDRKALLNALIKRWREQNTGNLIMQTELYAETITEAVLNLFDCWINPQLFDAPMDFAIRNWAQHSTDLKEVLEQTDEKRISAIKAMLCRFGMSHEQADIRAHTMYYTQVGYISMMVQESLPDRLERMPAYVENFVGQYPTRSEIARFKSRHRNSISGLS